MKYLLDVNVLLAWGWADHEDHARVARWIGMVKKRAEDKLLTSAIPQLGFVRVSAQRSRGQVSPEMASAVLSGMLHSLGETHVFVSDDQESSQWPAWCHSAPKTTNAHLLLLAEAHGAGLATMDRGIPKALIIP